MKTVYFIRHGQTQFNRDKRLQGWRDSPLTDQGREHARHVAGALTPFGIRSALVSPLGRAMETAEIIRSELNLSLEPFPALREVSFGDFEGNTLPELDEKFPGQWRARTADKWGFCPPGGEANKDAVPRAREVVQRIEAYPGPEPLLIVAHFAINRLVFSLLAGIESDDTVRIDVPHTVIYRAQKQNGAWELSHTGTEKSEEVFQPGWLIQHDPHKPMGG